MRSYVGSNYSLGGEIRGEIKKSKGLQAGVPEAGAKRAAVTGAKAVRICDFL